MTVGLVQAEEQKASLESQNIPAGSDGQVTCFHPCFEPMGAWDPGMNLSPTARDGI